MLEMGGYHDEADFDRLELLAYQRIYLNAGPFPTRRGPGLDPGRLRRSAAARSSTGPTACAPTDWVREEWAREHGLEGLDGADYDGHLDAVWERHRRQRRVQRPERAARAAAGGLREARLRLPPHHPQRRPRDLRPAARRLHGLRRPVGLEALDRRRPTSPTRRPSERRLPRQLPRRAGHRRGRPRRRGRGACGPIPLARRRTALRSRSRSALRWSSSPAARSSRRRCCCAPGSAAPRSATTCGCIPTSAVTGVYDEDQRWWWGPPQAALSHQFADLEDGYGFLIESRAGDDGPLRGRDALALRPRPQGADARLGPLRPVHQPHPRPRARPGRRSTPRATRSCTTRSPTSSTSRNFRRGLAELVRMHEAAGADARSSAIGRKRPDLEARRRPRGVHRRGHTHSRSRRASSASSPPTRWAAAGWAPTRQTSRRRTRWGELHDTPGVWIGDASAFPTASGTNPMVTIMALAHRTAEAIAAA